MRRTDLRLFPTATVTWALAALGVHSGATLALTAGAVLLIATLLAALLLGRSHPELRSAVLRHIMLLGILGAVLTPALLHHAQTARILRHAADTPAVLELTVRAVSEPETSQSGPEWAASSTRLRARTMPGTARIGTTTQPLPSSLPVLVTVPQEDAQTRPIRDGDRLRVRGTLRESSGLLILRGTSIDHEQPSGLRAMTAPASQLRAALRASARASTAHLPADEGALVRGMATGDTHGLSEEAEDAMRRAGISHLVAVSGANIALVIAAVLAPLLVLGVPRRLRLTAATLAMVLYVWVVGEEPSVQRAATMATPLLIARFAGVPSSAPAALAATVTIWSLADPVTSASVGFALSALATGAILLGARPAAGVLHELTGERISRTAALVITVPLLAQLACTPILVLLTPEISVWAVPVNMLVAPIVAPVTVLGLVALPLALVHPAAGAVLCSIAAGGSHLVLRVAHLADSLPGSRIAVPEGIGGATIAVGVILLGAAAVIGRRSRVVRFAVAAVLVATLSPSIVRHTPLAPRPEWSIAACAVGQGDAVLLRAPGPDPTTVLIDTGPDPDLMTACLDLLAVQRIDLLVLTHPHADHTGGRLALTGQRTPRAQWICPHPDSAAQSVPNVPTTTALTGEQLTTAHLTIDVLWPPSAEAAKSAARREQGSSEGSEANNCSIVIAARWRNGLSLVALGDLEPAAQRDLAALNPPGADVVKVAHHGSRRQHRALYDLIGARTALVTVGSENSFGHPTQHTLDMLEGQGSHLVRTDQHGTVVLPAADSARLRSVGPPR